MCTFCITFSYMVTSIVSFVLNRSINVKDAFTFFFILATFSRFLNIFFIFQRFLLLKKRLLKLENFTKNAKKHF